MQSVLSRKPKSVERGIATSRDLSTGCGQGTPVQSQTAEAEQENHASEAPSKTQDSTFGVQSLEEVIQTAEDIAPQECFGQDDAGLGNNECSGTRISTPESIPFQGLYTSSPRKSPNRRLSRPSSVNTLSLPLTPVDPHSPTSESLPPSTPKSVGSMKSLHLSDDDGSADEATSQALASSVDDGDRSQRNGQKQNPSQSMSEDFIPQLVMPSIRMPRRRPFTERGKNMGNLKVMVVGQKGVGKTSLIKSIVHLCDDIVYVDPFPSERRTSKPSASQREKRRYDLSYGTQKFAEINASTRSYPSWWTDLEGRGRRKSLSEPVLDRNICFIDTPGYGVEFTDSQASSVVRHIEDYMRRNSSLDHLSDNELLSIFSGAGGVHVDLVLHVMSRKSSVFLENHDCLVHLLQPPRAHHFGTANNLNAEVPESEWELIRALSNLTNVLPIVGESDWNRGEGITKLQSFLTDELEKRDIDQLHPRLPPGPSHSRNERQCAFAVSSAFSNDSDNMDASLLMSPDYTQPLIPSDLPQLIDSIFNPSTTAHLRHLSTRKFLRWRYNRSQSFPDQPSLKPLTSRPQPTLYNPVTGTSLPLHTLPLISDSVQPNANLNLHATARRSPTTVNFSDSLSTRLAEHTEHEQRLAQVHLARWAADLNRALRNERERISALQRAERAAWLREQLRDCADAGGPPQRQGGRGTMLPLTSMGSEEQGVGGVLMPPGEKGGRRKKREAVFDPRDPLGMLEWRGRLVERGLVLVKVLGGVGMVGAVVVWCARAWGWEWGCGGGSGGGGEGLCHQGGRDGGIGELLASWGW